MPDPAPSRQQALDSHEGPKEPASSGHPIAEVHITSMPPSDLAATDRAAVEGLFRSTYRQANASYLNKSIATLDTIAVAQAAEGLVGFALGAQRTADLPGLPRQIVLLGGLTCIAGPYRRLGLSRRLQRAAVGGDELDPAQLTLAAGRMAHPATLRLARGAPGAVPAHGHTPTTWQKEVGAAVASLYRVAAFDSTTFVCIGDGHPIGEPILDVEADEHEWAMFASVQRERGDSLLALWWGPSGAPEGWDSRDLGP